MRQNISLNLLSLRYYAILSALQYHRINISASNSWNSSESAQVATASTRWIFSKNSRRFFFTRSTVQCFPCHKYARNSISSLPAKLQKKNLQKIFQSCNATYRSRITLSIIIQVCWKWRIILCISHLIVEERHLFDYHKVSWNIQYNITAVNRVQCQSFFSQVLYAYIFSRQNRWLVAVNLIHFLDSPLNGLSLNWIPLYLLYLDDF